MVYNADIEKLILESKCKTLPDKLNDVALQIANESAKKIILRKLDRFWEKRRLLKKDKNQTKYEQWSADIFEIPQCNEDVGPAGDCPSVFNAGGRPKKRLGDSPGKKTEVSILDEILDNIENKALEQNITPQVLLQKIVDRSATKWNETKQENKSIVPVEDACAMIYNINFSLRQYQKLRSHLLPYSCILPTRNDVDIYKKKLLCEINVESTKTSCTFPVLVKDTVESILDLISVPNFCEGDILNVEGKVGIDGSGSHQIRQQVVDDDITNENKSETNYIGIFWCPLSIKLNNSTIWNNILPNSTMYTRPLCLMREKENRESVLTHFEPYIEEIHHLEAGLPITVNGTHQIATIHTEMSMIDGKMVDLIQGDSGGFCHYCYTTRAKANDLTCLLQGFPIEKNVQDMLDTWEKVASGEMAYSDPERSGQCHRPLNKDDLRFFAIMHQKLRSLDSCLKLLYHLVSGQTHTWSESSPEVKGAIKAAKRKCIDHIRLECGFLVDCPTQIGGNTNSGPIAEKFFSATHRNGICDLIENLSDRESYAELLSYFNKMLSLTQQCDVTKVVKVDMVRNLGLDLMVFYKQKFPFAMLSPSVHQMCAHSWELFAMTGGRPIALYAEQSGEAWNKHIRAYKSGPSARARQCSIKLNTLDIFTRMLVQSHPIVASKRQVLKCKRCEKYGHTVRSCPLHVHTVLDSERSFIESCFN